MGLWGWAGVMGYGVVGLGWDCGDVELWGCGAQVGMGLLLDSYGAAMEQLWGSAMGQLWGGYGIALEQLWGGYGAAMGRCGALWGTHGTQTPCRRKKPSRQLWQRRPTEPSAQPTQTASDSVGPKRTQRCI